MAEAQNAASANPLGHKNAAAASATAVVDSADACCGLATAVLSGCVVITDFVAGFPNGCCGLGSGHCGLGQGP